MKDNIFIKLGKNIIKLRIKAGLTISQLSKKTEVSKSTLIAIENGKANPLLSTILKLSKGLKIDLSILVKGL